MDTHSLLEQLTVDDIQGESQGIAEAIGMEAYIKLLEYHGGDTVYIPQPDRLAQYVRQRLVRQDFNGFNHKELAKKWGLTVRSIYMIVEGSHERS